MDFQKDVIKLGGFAFKGVLQLILNYTWRCKPSIKLMLILWRLGYPLQKDHANIFGVGSQSNVIQKCGIVTGAQRLEIPGKK